MKQYHDLLEKILEKGYHKPPARFVRTFLACNCGVWDLKMSTKNGTVTVFCDHCNKTTAPHPTRAQARDAWNKIANPVSNQQTLL